MHPPPPTPSRPPATSDVSQVKVLVFFHKAVEGQGCWEEFWEEQAAWLLWWSMFYPVSLFTGGCVNLEVKESLWSLSYSCSGSFRFVSKPNSRSEWCRGGANLSDCPNSAVRRC